jgi:hypothetical protein
MSSTLKNLPFGGAGAVEDPHMRCLVQDLVRKSAEDFTDLTVHERFVNEFQQWIKRSQLNCLSGLDAFPVACYSNGSTEVFDKFYLKHTQRRFRCFRGEYMYHIGAYKNYQNWAYMDQDQLRENDALVISLPFSDLGDVHPATAQTLDQCAVLGIPVLVDCTYFGLCAGIEFDLDHPAVTDVAFSLSKVLPVATIRIGMRLTRSDHDDSLQVYNKIGYVNRLGAGVGLKALNQISADANWQKWHTVQEDFCKQLGVTPSKTVIFGLDSGTSYQDYNRGGVTNRLSFFRHLCNGSLPNNTA